MEVFATVQDQKGRFVDGLPKERFLLTDEGAPQPIASFESEAASLSCALLLDTTGSMLHALPAVKNAAGAFFDELRPTDFAAAYSFSSAVNLLQDFTVDRDALKRAVVRTRAEGATALFDAIAQVAHEISGRSGKKVILVFTDGDDNASLLRAGSAIERAKKAGIPVYTVAEGDALKTPRTRQLLRSIATESGAMSYEAKKPSDIATIFRDISDSMRHTYLLSYKPPSAAGPKWRAIHLSVDGLKNAKVHAKEGYFPE